MEIAEEGQRDVVPEHDDGGPVHPLDLAHHHVHNELEGPTELSAMESTYFLPVAL